MALGFTNPVAQMITTNLPRSKRRSPQKSDNLLAICEPRRLTTLWAPRPVVGIGHGQGSLGSERSSVADFSEQRKEKSSRSINCVQFIDCLKDGYAQLNYLLDSRSYDFVLTLQILNNAELSTRITSMQRDENCLFLMQARVIDDGDKFSERFPGTPDHPDVYVVAKILHLSTLSVLCQTLFVCSSGSWRRDLVTRDGSSIFC
jgi:hypothetical protein